MCNACIPMLNTAHTTDDFADRLVDMLNQGALSLMVSIGHRTGLFDTLAELPPSSSHEIADHCGLDERYVREWLGAMVTGGIIQYRIDEAHYSLPESHAAVLTRAASPNNIAVFAQYIGLLGSVEDRVVDCFREGGGVGYEHYPRFHAVMAEDSGQTVLSALDEHILPLVTHMIPKLQQGIRVLDIGCGRARVILRLAAQFPRSEFVGLDLSTEALEEARQEADRQGLTNILFRQQDLTHFDRDAESEAYDWVTAFDAIHDQAAPQNVLNGIYRTLKPGGTFLMQDIHASSRLENNIEHPIGPLLYTISTLHCMTVSLAQGGAGLGTMWGEELAREMLGVAGFSKIDVKQLDHDFQNSFYVIRKAA